MAFLVRTDGSGRRLGHVVLVLLALAGSGCLVLEQLGWHSTEPAFSHAIHVGDEELECLACHSGYEDGDEPGYPPPGICQLCHEEDEDDPDAGVAKFFEGDEYRVAHDDDLGPDVIFSHLAHVTDEEACSDCHEAVIESDRVRPWMAISMAQCVDCHEEREQPTSCDVCHEELRTDVPPSTHSGAWDQFHGMAVRDRSDLTVDQCSICHQESACVTCHQIEMPANHNVYWRRRGHGLTARMDRDNCAACHAVDYCDRCHDRAEPQSHSSGLWGSSRNMHCYKCHLSGDDQESCSMCHKSGAPSHAMAPPQPPGHNPASDCRECHMIISHVDNGDDCNACHH